MRGGAPSLAGDAMSGSTGGSVTEPAPSDGTTTPPASDEAGEGMLEEGPDTTPPEVTAAVEGNFGLVPLTAVATDNVRLDGVRFLSDGELASRPADPAFVSTDPADRYISLFDTAGLADGPHTLHHRPSPPRTRVGLYLV